MKQCVQVFFSLFSRSSSLFVHRLVTVSEKLVFLALNKSDDGMAIFCKHVYFHNRIHKSISDGVLKKGHWMCREHQRLDRAKKK